jgi:hypothetical protein
VPQVDELSRQYLYLLPLHKAERLQLPHCHHYYHHHYHHLNHKIHNYLKREREIKSLFQMQNQKLFPSHHKYPMYHWNKI